MDCRHRGQRSSTTPEIKHSRSISGVIAGLSWWWRPEEVHNEHSHSISRVVGGGWLDCRCRGQRSSTTPEIERRTLDFGGYWGLVGGGGYRKLKTLAKEPSRSILGLWG